MANQKQAMREMRGLLGMFRNLHELAEEIDRAGDVDQYIRKLKNEATTLERQNAEISRAQDEAKARLDEIKEAAKKAKISSDRQVEQANTQANIIIENAKKKEEEAAAAAKKTRESAEAELRDTKKKVTEMLVQAKRDCQGVVLQARIEAGKVEGETLQANKRLEVVRSDIAAAERQLQALRSEIESLRAKFAS
jgi:chromosome segregation ATPase